MLSRLAGGRNVAIGQRTALAEGALGERVGLFGRSRPVFAHMLQLTGVMPMRPIRLLVLAGLLFIGTVVVAAALLLSNLQERALAEKTRELDNIVRLLSEHTDRALRATEN